MATVPRERFVTPDLVDQAYEDRALPAGAGQTISQPYVVAVMTSAAAIRSTDRVLDVGTGTGYQAAILAGLARKVVSVERIPSLALAATERLRDLGITNIDIHLAPEGHLGWPNDAPYDAIIVGAGSPNVPAKLIAQLAAGGRMVIPIGDVSRQNLVLITKAADGSWRPTDLGPCVFVPLIGPGAWNEDRT